jgi:hypothetical protein
MPCHECTERLQGRIQGVPESLQGQFWRRVWCRASVSVHQLKAASQHPCDGTMRGAICNARPMGPGVVQGSWAGLICQKCYQAHQEALTVRPTPQAVAP